MARKYVFVRMPADIYAIYAGIRDKMQTDVSRFTGKPIKITMPKVFRAVVSPQFNENCIQVDLKKLQQLARARKHGK